MAKASLLTTYTFDGGTRKLSVDAHRGCEFLCGLLLILQGHLSGEFHCGLRGGARAHFSVQIAFIVQLAQDAEHVRIVDRSCDPNMLSFDASKLIWLAADRSSLRA